MSKNSFCQNYLTTCAESYFCIPCVPEKFPKGHANDRVISMAFVKVSVKSINKLANVDETKWNRYRFDLHKDTNKWILRNAETIIETPYTLASFDKTFKRYWKAYKRKLRKTKTDYLNRGWYWEKVVYNLFGKRWKGKDKVPYTVKGDIKLPVYGEVQMKYYRSEFKLA